MCSLRNSPGRQLCSGGRCQPPKQRERRLQTDSASLAYRLAPVRHKALIQRDVLSAAQQAPPGTHATSLLVVTFFGASKNASYPIRAAAKNPRRALQGP